MAAVEVIIRAQSCFRDPILFVHLHAPATIVFVPQVPRMCSYVRAGPGPDCRSRRGGCPAGRRLRRRDPERGDRCSGGGDRGRRR
uniref:Uncharacterized protein n=1 Tax=Zea mays TaxID=4577 RepID=C0P3H0_MAIZE|nr:unknown [Zea mays]